MIIYTGGTFDLLHPGHLALLSACRTLAGPSGRVVVALNRDEFVTRYKRRQPVMSYEDRRSMLLALRDVDMVVPNIGDEDSKATILAVQPDIIAIGDDWVDRPRTDEPHDPWGRYKTQMGFTTEWLEENGIELRSISLLGGRSSTHLREAVTR